MSERDARSGPRPDGRPAAGASVGELVSRRADPRTNAVVKVVLRTGLVAALCLLAVGLVVQLASGHHEAFQVRMFGLLSAHAIGEKIMGVGVLVLAVTPACAVVSLVVRWAIERDWRFVGVGVVVVVVLSVAVAVGFLGA